MMELNFRPLSINDIPAVKAFTDHWIGDNYYGMPELEQSFALSQFDSLNASFVACQGDKIVAIRLTYAPGEWLRKCGRGATPGEWKVSAERVAYFKSLFVDDSCQKMGVGKKLSSLSIDILKQMGAQAIICHSWLESPGNSSQIYLQRMGFEPIKEHALFWNHIDYLCTRCRPHKCVCTVLEMIKYL